MILDCASESLNVIRRLFICLGQLRIIEYLQSANEPQKHLIWRALQQQLTSNGFIEKYPATPVDRFKEDMRPKTHPCFYVIILMILYEKRDLYKVLWCFDQFS